MADLRRFAQKRFKSSFEGSRIGLYEIFGFRPSNWCCRFWPMTSSALCDGMVCGSTHASRTAHGFVLMMSGGSTSMFRQRTSAACAVLIFPGAARHGIILGVPGGGGVGLPQVRWRFAAQ